MTRAALVGLAVLALLTGCGYSDQESTYLTTVQERSSAMQIDEDAELERGKTVCEVLRGTKPDDRRVAASLLLQRGYPIWQIKAATTNLCTDITQV